MDNREQIKALEHCRRIKSVYKEVKRLGHARYMNHGGSYTHIPMDLWEVLETMLLDDVISEKEEEL